MLGGITPATARGRDTKLLEEILANTATAHAAPSWRTSPRSRRRSAAPWAPTYSALGKFDEATANLQRADSLQTVPARPRRRAPP